ncbi:N-6 DNA Methylase [Neomoorella glycerini]|uniref:site-specific DNA-methyltransferase (adenine-specific) n=1 Tax=Neomoorella glycerini TaxID=55779 RepID=A0A6I5ZRS7_9FIRM|nr:N-6 DNA methylase [Moorella glycerini]QGP92267.1 N-6 DNA Methylase [Moorella glycerini]
MSLDILETERIIKEEAPRVAALIRQAGIGGNEEQFRQRVAPAIEEFGRRLGLNFHTEHERTLLNGRADTVYNRLVVEYERPRSLNKSNKTRSNRHALDQVKQYIDALHRLERHRRERLAGVVLDGTYYIFARYKEDRWLEDDPLPVSPASTERFLRYLTSLSTEKAVTPDKLIDDFGENTVISRKVVSTFYKAVIQSYSSRVKVLFDQWSRQFREICGYAENSSKLEIGAVARRFGVQSTRVETLPFFFALHTYYATFIKILAMQVVTYYAFPRLGTGLAQVASFPPDELLKYLRKNLQEGGIFREFGLKNFLEGDFFNWYLDTWDEAIASALSSLIATLADYSLVTLDVDPEETRDLLKKLYQQLVPASLRHNLGEYYTPDWLAERLLNQLEAGKFQGDLNKKILDPACGSGTFLVLAIRKMREYALEKMIPESQVLEKILEGVVGFDLNPLAVISARTNYLLAIGDLLAHRRGEVDIPVYLADSILTPSEEQNPLKSMQQNAVSFKAAEPVGTFTLPKSLVDASYVDRLTGLLEEGVRDKLSLAQFHRRLLASFPLLGGQDERDIALVENLYQKLLDLEAGGLNGIWASIIKNAFQPLFRQNYFDYVVGNPPWVNWESLPEDYRADTKFLWEYYGLFPHGGMDTILGKGKKDISMLLTYVAMDRYLKPQGKLGFVITQSVFKTSGAGQGFRRFKLPGEVPVRVMFVDDLSELQPFEGASNRTSIVILQKGMPNRYPVGYNYWRKSGRGNRISPDLDLDEVLRRVRVMQFAAGPVAADDPTSAWLTGREKAIKAVKKIIGLSEYKAHEGVNSGGANGVYWVEIVGRRPDGLVVVSNITEGTKREVEEVTAAIEPDLLYPLLRGRDVRKWQARPSAWIIMAQDPVRRRGIPEDEMVERYPRTYSYLKRFEEVLRERAAFKRYFIRKDRNGNVIETGPFYSMFDVGDYTFNPYKVVWPNIASKIEAAVIDKLLDGKVLLPQHIVTLIACGEPAEAHYLCALMNSSTVNFALQSYSMKGGKSFGDPHILENVAIPIFDPTNKLHFTLASLSQKAHTMVVNGDNKALAEIEEEIDLLAARLWGLTEAELKDIKDSLAELA